MASTTAYAALSQDARSAVLETDMWSWGRAKVLVEIAKCGLVCANCHRIRTQARMIEEAA